MQTHELKTEARFFEAVERGEKTFEVRRNDRAFQTGDILELVKTSRGTKIPRPGAKRDDPDPWHRIRFRITYILQGGQFGVEPAYCVLGLGPCESAT